MPNKTTGGTNTPTNSPFLVPREAAAYLRLSPKTLMKMRTQGRGPRYRKHGRYVRYHIADLENWSASRAQRSTSGGVLPPGQTDRDEESEPHA
jgi:predicted DNA-binding transcriptional regulator AlpA